MGLAPEQWWFAFQSQGMSGGPWIGPTVEDTLTALRERGRENLVIQPIGFLCDHVEILYDIDVAFREYAQGLGMTIRRPESLNDSRLLTLALADLARTELALKRETSLERAKTGSAETRSAESSGACRAGRASE